MNRLLCPALLLVILSAGCRRPTEPEKPTGSVQLEVFSRSLTKDAIVFDYRLTNRLRGTIRFICPDSACSSDPDWPQLPFYELNESSVLAVSGYHARKPFTEISDPYQYELMKLEPGATFSGHVSLKPPYVTNRPYPSTPNYHPETIWSPMIDRIRLIIGYYVCPGTETEPECSVPIDAEHARLDKENTGEYLDCGLDEDEWQSFPQHLISAEAGIAHTGDWPDPNPFRQFEASMDAGR